MDNWEKLQSECAVCHRCSLGDTRQNLVFGAGNTHSKVMLIGEGPGEQEDRSGIPFVGPAGQLLDSMLEMIGLNREKVYIANVVKCRPPRNRDPLGEEQNACIEWLERQIELVDPVMIVFLGRIAAMRFIGEDFRISRQHGEWFDLGSRHCMATYHPSALLRDVSKRPEAFMDLRSLRSEIRKLCPEVYS